MALTEAQIAEEVAFVQTFLEALAKGPEDWAALYDDDATIVRQGLGLPPIQGKEAIAKFCQFSHKTFENVNFTKIVSSVDEANKRIAATAYGFASLAADPEKKVLASRWVFIIEKPLGVGAKQITREEAIHDPIVQRVIELGINPEDMVKGLTS